MKKYHVILLAGGEKGPLFEKTGFLEKALIPIHGIPMLSRVIEVFYQAEYADEIVVVGSSNLNRTVGHGGAFAAARPLSLGASLTARLGFQLHR